MKDYKLGKHSFKLWTSIKELPADRFSDFQKYLIQASGVGSDMAAVNAHFTNLDLFLSAGKLDEARQERLNLQRNIFYSLSGISIDSYVFACLVAELDGQPVTDFTEPGLSRTLETLKNWGITYGTIADTLDEVKKKLIAN